MNRKNRGFKPPTVRKATDQELLNEIERRKPEWTQFEKIKTGISKADEGWANSRYTVWIYKPGNTSCDNGDWNRLKEPPEQEVERYIHLSIKNHDRTVLAHDWRDLMRIKNELISRDAEAIELYPRMDRLCDEANQYHLWVLLPPLYRNREYEDIDWPVVPVGWRHRLISDESTADTMGAKQRAFEDGFLSDEDEKDMLTLERLDEARRTGYLTPKDDL